MGIYYYEQIMAELILPLADASDVRQSGGKGASLSRLIKAGFNVPPGFVVTAEAANPRDLEKEILGSYDELDTELVAVRSSAVAEDGSKDAWAGQLDTFLNVRRDNLIAKIRACQRSAKSSRAEAYARQKGINAGGVAVIVQAMIPSEVSGVAFSANPITNNHGQMIIEAVKGLGETLVSGQATPDTYILDKGTLETVEKHLMAGQILYTMQLSGICAVVKKIEAVFGYPVDVEWALAKDKLHILQSRPITTLG